MALTDHLPFGKTFYEETVKVFTDGTSLRRVNGDGRYHVFTPDIEKYSKLALDPYEAIYDAYDNGFLYDINGVAV